MKKPSVKPIRESKENRSVRKGRAVFPSEYFKCLLFLIVFGAFLFRCIVAFQLIAADPAAYAPSSITDMATYCALADAVLSGNLPDTFYYQPFYYSVFLPLCRLFTTSPHVLAVVQSLLGAAVVYGAGLIGAKIFGRRAGLWSALLCALSAILIYFTPYALLETVQSFWILFLFFALQAALRKKRLFLWCGAGLLLGFSILTRGNTWCFLPVVFCAVFYVERRNWKKALLPLLLFIVFTLLPQLPFAAYNTFKTGKLSGPSTAGGAVLCIGNNPESAPGGLDIPYPPTYEAWMKDEKKISVPARMLDWFLREPAAFLELQFNKFLLFWDSTEWPNNISEYNAGKSSLMRTFRFLPTGFLIMLALAGGFSGCYRRMFLRRKEFLLLWGCILFYALSVSAFYILARFRLPVIPLLCVSGGVFLAQFLRRMKMRRFFHYLLILLLAAGFAYFAYPVYSTAYEPALMRSFRPAGVNSVLDSFFRNTVLIQDHTQRIRGGWGSMALKDGMTIEKTFAVRFRRSNCGKMVRLILRLPVGGTNYSFLLDVNGQRRFIANEKSVELSIPPVEKDRQIELTLKISHVRGDPQLYFDALRNYGRTQVDGKTVPYELVATLLTDYEFTLKPLGEK